MVSGYFWIGLRTLLWLKCEWVKLFSLQFNEITVRSEWKQVYISEFQMNFVLENENIYWNFLWSYRAKESLKRFPSGKISFVWKALKNVVFIKVFSLLELKFAHLNSVSLIHFFNVSEKNLCRDMNWKS